MSEVPESLRVALSPDYVVEREIGAGGMARIYLAQQEHPRRRVAVKVLDPDLCNRLYQERFLREVELASRLSHPHIVPIFAAGGVDCHLYYVMPYLEGESLRQRLERDGRLPLEESLHIAADVADALSYAHAHGVIHRDIKPENILLSGGHAVVADFGIARAISAAGRESLTATGQPIGSPQYMSPEQAFGATALDARTDIYSLGCVLFEMLTGAPPVRSPLDPLVQNWDLLDGAPGLRATATGTRRAVRHALSRALAALPDDRFSSVAELMAALGGLAHRPSLPSRSPLASRRTRRALASVALVLALAVGAAAVFGKGSRTLDPRRVVVTVIENHTGDPALDNLGHLAAEWLTQAVAQTGLVEVAPASAAPQRGSHLGAAEIRALAAHTGAGTVVSGAYYRQGDSVLFQLQITDAGRGQVVQALDPVAATVGAPQRAVDLLRQRVVAALAARFDTSRAR